MEAWRFGGFGKQQESLKESVEVRGRGGERVGGVRGTQLEPRMSQRKSEGASVHPKQIDAVRLVPSEAWRPPSAKHEETMSQSVPKIEPPDVPHVGGEAGSLHCLESTDPGKGEPN